MGGNGSAAQRRPAAGSAAMMRDNSISAMGLPAAWASTCSRARPRGGCGWASSSRPASGVLSGSSSSSGKSRSNAGGGRFPRAPSRSDQRFCFQAPGGEGERVERAAVQPLRVVGDHQQRAVLRQAGQQGEHGDPGQQGIGRHRVRGQRERSQQRLRLAIRQVRHPVEHRAQQLVQAGER